jgi:hypothetical protein
MDQMMFFTVTNGDFTGSPSEGDDDERRKEGRRDENTGGLKFFSWRN